MKPLLRIHPVFFQLTLTFGMLLCIFMFFVINNTDEFDFINGIALLTIQPLYGIVLSSISIAICFILGLPIRLNSKLNLWWTKNVKVSIAVLAVGIIFLILSLLSPFLEITTTTINGELVDKKIPNSILAISGWFFTCFGSLHYYPSSFLNIISFKKKIE